MQSYRTFRRFDAQPEAASFVQFLAANGIPATVEKVPPLLDGAIIGQTPAATIEVKVPQDYFPAAQRLLRDHVRIDLDQVEADYYLLGFSDEELIDIVRHPDEWGEYDQALAVALLQQRGIPITAAEVESAEAKRIETLAHPKPLSTASLVLLYLAGFCGTVLPVISFKTGHYPLIYLLLILAPIASGVAFITGRKTLPDGRSAYLFDPRARMHGYILVLLFTMLTVLMFLALFRS